MLESDEVRKIAPSVAADIMASSRTTIANAGFAVAVAAHRVFATLPSRALLRRTGMLHGAPQLLLSVYGRLVRLARVLRFHALPAMVNLSSCVAYRHIDRALASFRQDQFGTPRTGRSSGPLPRTPHGLSDCLVV